MAPGQHRLALPRLEAARLLMLWALPPASDLAAVMGADLLTTLLAEGRRSRLVALLREELQLVESIDQRVQRKCRKMARVFFPGDV